MTAASLRLGELVDIVMGQAPPGPACNKDGTGTVFVKAGEFQERFPLVREWTTQPLKMAAPDDTLVCVVGATAGKVNYSAFECAIGRSVAAVRPQRARLDPLFLYQFLQTKVEQLRDRSQGAAQGVITREMLQSLRLVVPTLPEQRRIAAILDKADTLRSKRREALDQIDRLGQAIFVEMFEDELGKRLGWPEVHLSNVADTLTGYPFQSNEYAKDPHEAVRLCRGSNVMPGRLDWSDTAWWPLSKTSTVEAFELREGDIVMAMDRPWISEGFKLARIERRDCPSYLLQRVTRIRAKPSSSNDYLYHLLAQPQFTRHCKPTETTVPHISPKEIRSFRFHLPPSSLQKTFAERVITLGRVRSDSEAAMVQSESLFAALQHRAFLGEL